MAKQKKVPSGNYAGRELTDDYVTNIRLGLSNVRSPENPEPFLPLPYQKYGPGNDDDADWAASKAKNMARLQSLGLTVPQTPDTVGRSGYSVDITPEHPDYDPAEYVGPPRARRKSMGKASKRLTKSRDDFGLREKDPHEFMFSSIMGQLWRWKKHLDEVKRRQWEENDRRVNGRRTSEPPTANTGDIVSRSGYLSIPFKAGSSYERRFMEGTHGQGYNTELSDPRWSSSGTGRPTEHSYHMYPFLRMDPLRGGSQHADEVRRAREEANRTGSPKVVVIARGMYSLGDLNTASRLSTNTHPAGGDRIAFVRICYPDSSGRPDGFAFNLPDKVRDWSPQTIRDALESDTMSAPEAARHVNRIVREMLTSPRTQWNADGTHQMSEDLSRQLHEYMTIAHPDTGKNSFTDVARILGIRSERGSGTYHVALPNKPHGRNGELGFPVDENNARGPRTHVGIRMEVNRETGTPQGTLYDASRDPNNFVYTDRERTGVGTVDNTQGHAATHTWDHNPHLSGNRGGDIAGEESLPHVQIHRDAVARRDALASQMHASGPEGVENSERIIAVRNPQETDGTFRPFNQGMERSFFAHAMYVHEAGNLRKAIMPTAKLRPPTLRGK